MPSYGALNAALTAAINRLAKDSDQVTFTRHSEVEMDNDGFDHAAVLMCLRRGKVFGPESQNGQLRGNVVHRGLQVRVVIGGLDRVEENWAELHSVKVITVMKAV